MKVAIAIALIAGAAARTDRFASWAAKNGKKYASREEMTLRRNVFAANLRKIEAHNAAGHSWTMGVNKFADLTADEFKARYASGFRTRSGASRGLRVKASKKTVKLPSSVDWSAKGAVTPIKNQGQCGSCWAFSTTGSTEGAVFIATGTLPSLSEQQLVDCSGAEGNEGCDGGLMDDAFQYIIDNKGITSEAQYPYTAEDGTCNTSVTAVATITGFTDVTPDSDDALMTAIAQQPVSVAVEADQDSFQLYTGGVMTAACGTALDHGVLAVGYGTDASAGGDYYKVKNSWGADWGEAGYIRLGRGSSYNGGAGQCGILMMSSYPTGANTA